MVSLSIQRNVGRPLSCPTWLQVLCLTSLIWAGIYLPGLGSVELKHEEPRRALPALHMLSSGDWLVPRVGDAPYLRKPPLLQWLIALSFRATHSRSEWAVRLPSALATLALALSLVRIGGDWLGPQGGLLAAILFLTNLAVLETGRLAELEAVYVAFAGIGLLCWVSAWIRGQSGWRLWPLPAIFLSLAMLTKGPTHLVFFYGVIIPSLVFAKDLRPLFHPAHWCTLALVVGLFAAWAIPCSLAVNQQDPIGVWQFWVHELASRASGPEAQHFHLQSWLLNFPETLKNFLPWTLLLPLLWQRTHLAGPTTSVENVPSFARREAWFRGARLGMVVTSVLMALLPSGSPRYLYPLFPVPCLLLAGVLIGTTASNQVPDDPLIRKGLLLWKLTNLSFLVLAAAVILAAPFVVKMDWLGMTGLVASAVLCCLGWIIGRAHSGDSVRVLRQAITTATLFVVAMLVYASAIVPKVNALSYGAREVAGLIRAKLPGDATLWVDAKEYRPFWYYLEPRARYFLPAAEIPPDARYILLSKDADYSALGPDWKNTHFRTLADVVDNEQNEFLLLERRSALK